MKKVDRLPRSKIRIEVSTRITEYKSYVESGVQCSAPVTISSDSEFVFVSRDSGMISGVYEILNKVTGERYIGMSRNIRRRFFRHKDELRKGIHHCILLQNAYNSSPFTRPLDIGLISEVDELFEFNVIVFCRPSELTYWEHKLIKAVKPEYNTHMENGHSRARIAKEN